MTSKAVSHKKFARGAATALSCQKQRSCFVVKGSAALLDVSARPVDQSAHIRMFHFVFFTQGMPFQYDVTGLSL